MTTAVQFFWGSPDWVLVTLGDIVTYKNGVAHENSISHLGNYILVNSKFISTDGGTLKKSKDGFLLAEKNDILMVMSDVPNGRAIARTFLTPENNTYTVNQRICLLRANEDCPQLLSYNLNRNQYYLGFDDGAKQTNLRKGDVLNCQIPLPPSLSEQEAIAGALSDADAWIESLEKLIHKKRQIKQGAMQTLLSPWNSEGNTKTLKEGWIEKSFDDVFSFLTTATNSRSDLGSSGDAYYIHYGDIHTIFHSHLDLEKQKPLMINKDLCASATLLKNGDWVMADASEDYNGVGKSIEVEGISDGVQVVAGLHTFLLREKAGDFVDGFKGHLGNQKKLHEEFLRVATGMKVYGVSKTALKQLLISIPPKEEQTRIASILSDMDAEITTLEQKLEKARQIKQGMMQELLTGKTRLI